MQLPPPDTPILVVDDSKAIRAVLEAYLARLGYTNVRAVGTPDAALAAFREQGSRIVFLDVMLGEGQAIDFAAKALDERPFCALVVTTALPGSDDLVTDLVAHGARHFLTKPISLTPLKNILAKIEEARREEDEAAPFAPTPSSSVAGYQ